MFPVIEVGTFLEHSELKVVFQTEKIILKKENHLVMGKNVWYSLMMVLYQKVVSRSFSILGYMAQIRFLKSYTLCFSP